VRSTMITPFFFKKRKRKGGGKKEKPCSDSLLRGGEKGGSAKIPINVAERKGKKRGRGQRKGMQCPVTSLISRISEGEHGAEKPHHLLISKEEKRENPVFLLSCDISTGNGGGKKGGSRERREKSATFYGRGKGKGGERKQLIVTFLLVEEKKERKTLEAWRNQKAKEEGEGGVTTHFRLEYGGDRLQVTPIITKGVDRGGRREKWRRREGKKKPHFSFGEKSQFGMNGSKEERPEKKGGGGR